MNDVTDNTASYFYSGQLNSLLQQVIRIFSGFYYKTSPSNDNPFGELISVPCKYGDGSRLVAQLINNNSANTARTIPLFSVLIKDIQIDSTRRRGPSLENQLQVNERAIDPVTGRYTAKIGNSYEVSRLMPVAVLIKIQVDAITSNTSQLWQLVEQIALLFNPMIDIQVNENPLDWSALTTMELKDINYNSKSIPVGADDQYNVTTWYFEIPFHINPPAKVKRLRTVKTIITDIGRDDPNSPVDTWNPGYYSEVITDVADYKISVVGNSATLLGKYGNVVDDNGDVYSWQNLIDSLGKFIPNVTMIRLRPAGNMVTTNTDIYANFTLDTVELNKINLSFVQSTLPQPTVNSVNNIIDPCAVFPNNGIPINPTVGTRYLILKNIIPNTVAWGSFSAPANSIIEWNGSNWFVDLDPSTAPLGSIVQNSYNNKLYILISDDSWISVVEGQYSAGYWALGTFPDTTF
jgi:hypothetical protein